MRKIWYEEELSLEDKVLENTVKALVDVSKGNSQEIRADMEKEAHGIVRAFEPLWKPLDEDELKPYHSGRLASFYKIRLDFEFEISQENINRGVRFMNARCEAFLRSLSGKIQPEVYDLFPRDEYEGNPKTVKVKFAPELTIDKIGVSLGEIESDLTIGRIVPSVVAYNGSEKREPHWDLRPQEKSLLGTQNLWLVVALPQGCSKFRIASRVEAKIEIKFGLFSIGPKERVWENRPSLIIPS